MDKYLYEETRLKMAHRSKALGIWALVLSITLFLIPYVGLGLGALAIIFGLISKGYKEKLDKDVKIGIISAVIGMVISVLIMGNAIYKVSSDPELRKTFYNMSEYLYGDSLEEVYGENFYDMFKQYFGGEGNVDL